MRRLFPLLCVLSLLLLPACQRRPAPGEGEMVVTASTYPAYLMVCSVAEGVQGLYLQHLSTGQVSCLHDYTLTVRDMKAIEGADVLVLSGAGLEEFMQDALASSPAPVIDCSEGVELLENLSHDHQEGEEGHDHGHWDPHYWMDPRAAAAMAENIAAGLARLDPENEALYTANARDVRARLEQAAEGWQALLAERSPTGGLITFHDGFQYFARAFGLELLRSIEEEAGSEASAREIVEITALIRQYHIPAIFTEVNGSDATARAIQRETGAGVYQLDMIMSGDGGGVEDYIARMERNINTIVEALA